MVLNIPVLRICQVSAYARLRESSEYAASSKYSRTLNMARLLIFVGYTGCWKYLSKSEYALTMSQYVLICLNDGEYGSFKYAWILNVSHAVHEVTWVHEVTVQITEQLLKQTYWEHCHSFKIGRFAKRTMREYFCATRNFRGQGRFCWTRAVQ